MPCLPCLGNNLIPFMWQAKRRSAAQAHPRRSSATPKHAELMEEDAGPSTAALPAQHMANDAQQDEMQMESSEGGATAGSPAGGTMDMHAGSGHQSDGHEREAPRTLASRISRFAGIFTGGKSTPDTPTGKCSACNGACFSATFVSAMIPKQAMVSLGATGRTANEPFWRHQQLVQKDLYSSVHCSTVIPMMLHQA